MMEHYVDTPWREPCLYTYDSGKGAFMVLKNDEEAIELANSLAIVPPIDRPENMKFSVKEIERERNVLQKKVTISFDFMNFIRHFFFCAIMNI